MYDTSTILSTLPQQKRALILLYTFKYNRISSKNAYHSALFVIFLYIIDKFTQRFAIVCTYALLFNPLILKQLTCKKILHGIVLTPYRERIFSTYIYIGQNKTILCYIKLTDSYIYYQVLLYYRIKSLCTILLFL